MNLLQQLHSLSAIFVMNGFEWKESDCESGFVKSTENETISYTVIDGNEKEFHYAYEGKYSFENDDTLEFADIGELRKFLRTQKNIAIK